MYCTISKDVVDTFTAFLKTHGLKLTSQRRCILDRALSARKHFSAEELLGEVRRVDSTISKATVYRTLALLEEADLLDSMDFDRGYKLYEPASGQGAHHDHLICAACGDIVEFRDDTIEEAQKAVARAHGFEVVWHTHELYGFCSKCRERPDRANVAKQRTRTRAPRSGRVPLWAVEHGPGEPGAAGRAGRGPLDPETPEE